MVVSIIIILGLLSPVKVKFEMKNNFFGKNSEFNSHKKREKVKFEIKDKFLGKIRFIVITTPLRRSNLK